MHKQKEPIQSDEFTLIKKEHTDSKGNMNIEEWLYERGVHTPLERITKLPRAHTAQQI